jgi:hypothetical protein
MWNTSWLNNYHYVGMWPPTLLEFYGIDKWSCWIWSTLRWKDSWFEVLRQVFNSTCCHSLFLFPHLDTLIHPTLSNSKIQESFVNQILPLLRSLSQATQRLRFLFCLSSLIYSSFDHSLCWPFFLSFYQSVPV